MAALGGEGARIDCCSRPWLGEISTAGSSAGACGGVVGAPAHWWGERLPASSQNHKRPDVGGMGPASERMVAATGDKKYAGVLVVKGGGRLGISPGNGEGIGPGSSRVGSVKWREHKSRLGRARGLNTAGDPRPRARRGVDPDRGEDGGDDRPAASWSDSASRTAGGRTCAGLPRPRSDSTLGRLDMRRRYAVKAGFGPGAATAPLRLHNRRLASVISRLGPRSSILGDYRASAHLGSWLGECRPGLGGMRPAVLGGIASPSPVPSSLAFVPLPQEAPRSNPPYQRAAQHPTPLVDAGCGLPRFRCVALTPCGLLDLPFGFKTASILWSYA